MLNMDFNQRVVIETQKMPWTSSPAMGVERKPLEREAQEHGHVTSIVRYAAGSSFPEHTHPLGEEIYVLDGVFSDETGDFPKGTYLRNPPGSRHSPFSREGCVLFVKLNQMAGDDDKVVRIDTSRQSWHPQSDGFDVMPLHEFSGECVALLRWSEGVKATTDLNKEKKEILVIAGEYRDPQGIYPAGTWLRTPQRLVPDAEGLTLRQDTVIWLKQ